MDRETYYADDEYGVTRRYWADTDEPVDEDQEDIDDWHSFGEYLQNQD